MLARAASLFALVVALGSGLFFAGCAKPATGTTSCSSGQLMCGDNCVNAQSDPQNCGSCGKSCGNGSSCQGGSCSCSGGYVSCGGSCVASNTQHCGNSCTVCASGEVCNSDGTCSSTCTSGNKCSDNTCSSSTNPMNCGTCGNACPSGQSCVSGTCSCGSSTQMYCSGSCVDITGTANCGSCGNKCGSGQTCSNGNCTGGGSTGGTTGTGGNNPGTGGSGPGTGGSGPGTGGSGPGTGGSATGGSSGLAGGSGNRACGAPASGDVVADFEEGFNQNVAQGSRQGWWSAFGDTTAGSQTPAAGTTGPVAAATVSAPLPAGDTCDMYAVHSTATGHTGTSAYVGFGTSFAAVLPPPTGTTTKTRNPYDVSAYDGLSFNIKSSSGTAPPIWVEFQNTENVPTPDGTAKYSGVDQYNTRGMLLTTVGTSWTKVYVPFAVLAPRYLPNALESDCASSTVVCQAPPWDSKNTLGFQFGVYPQFAVQPFTSSSSLNYDLWVDDVSLYKGTNGLTAFTPGMLPADGASLGSCTKPAGASIKYLTDMYTKWKKTFVTPCGGNCVLRPENANDVVSEGIAYGMLIAVNMNDKTLFDALWSYEQGHKAAGNLMTWCLGSVKSGGAGSTCSQSGGSATDADEDMAFALYVAGKQWGGSYASTASSVISDIYSNDMDTTNLLPTGGSNYGHDVSSHVTNPSYFAPAYYRIFATIDTAHASQWNSIASNSYTAISNVANSSTGLLPAWCQNKCASAGSNGAADDGIYQYDAHRVPWRLGVDACWNGTTTGKTFLTNNSKFFTNQSSSGIGRVYDKYTLTGSVYTDAQINSTSAIGTAGVGAMAVGNSFASTAYQFILDSSYSPSSIIPDSKGKVAYSYFNATVGLLTALTMSGNFNH